MASPAQQKMRIYSYGFNGKSGYTKLLNTVHKSIQDQMKKVQNKQGAETLQNFLQNVKRVARVLMEQTSTSQNIKKTEGLVDRVMSETGDLYNWYIDLVQEVVDTEINIRRKKGLDKLSGNRYKLFRRSHTSETIDKTSVDDIFEEELATLFAVIHKKINNLKNVDIDLFTTGKSLGTIREANTLGKIGEAFYEGTTEGLQEMAKKQKMKVSSQVLGKEFKKEVAIKTDIQTLSYDINATFGLNNSEIDKIIPLLNEASFTAKNYLKTTISKAGGLKLGETNLLRSIGGILGSVFEGSYTAKNWRDMFYRGTQIMIKTNKPPSASPNIVMQHFYHMRFTYELSGLGLIDSKTFEPLFTKYLIYNEPDSDKIHVFDTATLILEELSSKSVVNTFGAIHLRRRF